ncbi:MAG: FAD/NAD(P)-binding protein [Candidatus Obscuribacterales bacterium]|jgi:NAD(P)H-flavin reductase|nr:FAD/NAD(P)-binding protein [Candidatus Obscuribacterales bacterium]
MLKVKQNLQSPFIPHWAIIRSITNLSEDNTLFELQIEDGDFSECKPGQFVQLWLPGVGESPISVCSAKVGETIELCIRRVGRVTNALFLLNEGERVGLRGPFGTGFPLEKYKGKNLCLIAGGLGIAPIRSLLQHVLLNREDYGKLILIYGLRHSAQLLFRHELKHVLRRRDIEVFISAEEIRGPDLPPMSMQLGRVTDMLSLAPVDESYEIAICGPPVMYKYVVQGLKAKGVKENSIWLSLERHMKCGMGKCGHCFVGGRFTCMQGPVFNLTELRFLPEAIECEGTESC